MICNLYPEPTFFVFTEGLPPLFYYSHLPTLLIVLLVGFIIYFSNRRGLENKLLFFIFFSYSLWVFFDVVVWTNINSELILMIWPWFGISSALISILSVYLTYVFVNKKDVSFLLRIIFTLLLVPLLIFAPTYLNLTGFNISNCDAYGFEGLVYKTYYVSLGVLAMLWIPAILLKKYFTADINLKKQILLFGMGIESFLFIFFSVTFLVSYLAGFGILEDSTFESYGLIGMVFFAVFLAILVVRFKTFNIGLLVSQALVFALIVLIGAILFLETTSSARLVTFVTLVISMILGWLLIRSVKKEIEQMKKLQVLTQQLAVANERLQELDKLKSEFLSIASHQLRSPLTAMRGYSSLILEGSYGCFDERMKEPLKRIHESAKLMATSIEDYLNVSRIESGNMKYNYSDFNLRDEVYKLCDDMRPEALKGGLAIIFRSELNGRGIVHADIGKTIQIVQNLITNAIKYTKQGHIRILVRDDVVRKKIFVDIIDTGIGIKASELESIFVKFERASNANTVNIHGTGLGLFVALKMAEAMGGGIKVSSEGEGKGSCFTFDLPLAM